MDAYRNERELPLGRVLIIGSGQSGCQIAEELHTAGREVVLSCGKAPWAPRRFGGQDLLWWADETGFLDAGVSSLPAPQARLAANILTSGHDGGQDLHLRTLADQGVVLAGHFAGVTDHRITFAPDLQESIAWGDERYRQFRSLVDRLAVSRGLAAPGLDDPEPFGSDGLASLAVADLGAVIFAAGFRPDYQALLPWPEAFDDWGFPIAPDGASTVVPGLYFVGVHFLRKRKSALVIGVGEDAAIVVRKIAE